MVRKAWVVVILLAAAPRGAAAEAVALDATQRHGRALFLQDCSVCHTKPNAGVYAPALGTAVYNQAKRSPCPLRFHIAAEGGWDLGGASAALICAGLLAAGAPLGACILLSLPGALASFVLLRRYYAGSAAAAPIAPIMPSAGFP